MHIPGMNNSFLSVLLIPSSWHLYFYHKLAAIFPQDETCTSRQVHIHCELLKHPCNSFFLQIIFTEIPFKQSRSKIFYNATAATCFVLLSSIYWANKDTHQLNVKSDFKIIVLTSSYIYEAYKMELKRNSRSDLQSCLEELQQKRGITFCCSSKPSICSGSVQTEKMLPFFLRQTCEELKNKTRK